MPVAMRIQLRRRRSNFANPQVLQQHRKILIGELCAHSTRATSSGETIRWSHARPGSAAGRSSAGDCRHDLGAVLGHGRRCRNLRAAARRGGADRSLECWPRDWENLPSRFNARLAAGISARRRSQARQRAKHRLRPLFMRSLRMSYFFSFSASSCARFWVAHPSRMSCGGRVRPSESSGKSLVMQEAAPM